MLRLSCPTACGILVPGLGIKLLFPELAGRFLTLGHQGGFFFFFFNFILFFNFTIFYWFCHISTWIHHRYTRVPHPEPSFFLPPCTIPLGQPSAPAPSCQYRASNLDWRLISYMIYMFHCHSPKSSHPLPLPRVQKTVLYISVYFVDSYTGLSLPSF